MEEQKNEQTPERQFTWEGAPISRRAFFNRMTAAGLGVAAASVFGGATLAGCSGGDSGGFNTGGGGNNNGNPFAGIKGNDVNTRALNYALQLEILEADLYRQALNIASGRPIAQRLDGGPTGAPPSNSLGAYRLSSTIGGGGLPAQLVQAGFLYLVQYAYVEAAHREFLLNALGTTFAAEANPKGYSFGAGGPGNNLKAILQNILVLEETGVRAYLGAVPYITDPSKAQVAGTIYSTEARHSAAVSYIVNNGDPGPMRMSGDKEVAASSNEDLFEKFLEPQTVLAKVKPFFVV